MPPDTTFGKMLILKGHYSHGAKNGMWFSNLRSEKGITSEINFINDTVAGPITVYKNGYKLFSGNAEKLSGTVSVKYIAKRYYKRISKRELLDSYSNLKEEKR